MTFGHAISKCLSRYADFSGRASRSEFGWFALFYFGLTTIASLANPELGLIAVAVFITPWFAVMVRRLHDSSKAGTRLFLLLIPIVGLIVIVDLFRPGDDRSNAYGPVPSTEPMQSPRAESGTADRSSVPAARTFLSPVAIELREHPHEAAPNAAFLPAGTRLSVVESVGPWMNVKGPRGATGWIEGSHLGFVPAPVELEPRLHPNEQAAQLSAVPPGTLVAVIETVGDWARIRTSDGTVGWLVPPATLIFPGIGTSAAAESVDEPMPEHRQVDGAQPRASLAIALVLLGVLAVAALVVANDGDDQVQAASPGPGSTTTQASSSTPPAQADCSGPCEPVGTSSTSPETSTTNRPAAIDWGGEDVDFGTPLLDLFLRDYSNPGAGVDRVLATLGEPDEEWSGLEGASAGRWRDASGPAVFEITGGFSLAARCNPEGPTHFEIVDGVWLCRSTLAEARAVIGSTGLIDADWVHGLAWSFCAEPAYPTPPRTIENHFFILGVESYVDGPEPEWVSNVGAPAPHGSEVIDSFFINQCIGE